MIRDPALHSALRRLIRAKNAAFRNDLEMLKVATQTLRDQAHQHRSPPAEKRQHLLSEIEQAISFLRNNVVQAPLNQRGNYVFDATRINESNLR
ncbi:hypothetical protein BWQ96_04562 [Gracilariopsis chorda]|uniref:Uncharacterized protein n=1 Tax=Gracilariopsis chorda TaxID=448386 RepID=A0A2V3IU44_9FLOR|nr:hypothetical protein BWQ96_04562 [Gracilariopsis chorda]|eukprot:PXF45658.1 hypothetical protein BWQ96_04562 [Gracilariopsis chorda]